MEAKKKEFPAQSVVNIFVNIRISMYFCSKKNRILLVIYSNTRKEA